ncbi:beta 1-4 rhamnosyltransferase Cps2T [Lacticaseibacillus paracasei]|uniref:beta 1-4 rhamnosyltransferase Cps2T n=2 Tax=Lacticaseibacillus paracasei TaxID=1597 RepID=UPI000DD2D81C|nr:DUF1972 domain-containing protein [Lacticaseibacillus paracasei]
MVDVFIVGSKGIPAQYGGYETFVDKLTENRCNMDIKYHVACKVRRDDHSVKRFSYNHADCFNVTVPKIGAAEAIYYDLAAINESIAYIKKNKIEAPILYILACRIGPFMSLVTKRFHSLGGKVYINPDGHEWKRAKWSAPVREYWKQSERMMVKRADLIVCDSKNIELYIRNTYRSYRPQTTFIAYGADLPRTFKTSDKTDLVEWLKDHNLKERDFYLVVGRFVPENNLKTIITEFMKSDTEKELVIISNVEQNKFYKQLLLETKFDQDSRIRFVGTVYNKGLLTLIRSVAAGYIHGHSVGGTNPSLLEALAATDVNLLFDVGFNKEVAEKSAIYWSLKSGSLSAKIHQVDSMDSKKIKILGKESTDVIRERYSWLYIVKEYEKLFTTHRGTE